MSTFKETATRDDIVQTLAACQLFSGFEPEHLRDIIRIAQPFHLDIGEELFAQGDPGDFLYIIGTGQLQAFIQFPGKVEQPLTIDGPGSIIGELALVEGNIRSATVRAIEESTGVKVSRNGFESIRLALDPINQLIMRRLCRHLAMRIRNVYSILERRLESDASNHDQAQISIGEGTTTPVDEADIGYISSLHFFRNFDMVDLRQLLDGLVYRHFNAGEFLALPNRPLDYLYITIKGAVESTLRHGELTQRVRLAGPGTAGTYLSLVDDKPNVPICRTRERTLALEIPRARFSELFYGDSVLSQQFIVSVQIDLAHTLRNANRPPAWMLIVNNS